jgi:hypothetical protein
MVVGASSVIVVRFVSAEIGICVLLFFQAGRPRQIWNGIS